MKIQWNEWDIGGKIIFVSTCVAIFSFLLPWVDIGIASQNGISQGTILLGILYIYPVFKLLKSQVIERKWGILCGTLSILLTLTYILSKSGEIFGKQVNVAGSGAYLFFATSIALIVGVIKYKKIKEKKVEDGESDSVENKTSLPNRWSLNATKEKAINSLIGEEISDLIAKHRGETESVSDTLKRALRSLDESDTLKTKLQSLKKEHIKIKSYALNLQKQLKNLQK